MFFLCGQGVPWSPELDSIGGSMVMPKPAGSPAFSARMATKPGVQDSTRTSRAQTRASRAGGRTASARPSIPAVGLFFNISASAKKMGVAIDSYATTMSLFWNTTARCKSPVQARRADGFHPRTVGPLAVTADSAAWTLP